MSEPMSHVVVNQWLLPHHGHHKRWGKGAGEGQIAPPAGAPFHEKNKSFRRCPPQTSGDQTCHMATLSCTGGWQSKAGFFFGKHEKMVKYQDNYAFLKNVQPLLWWVIRALNTKLTMPSIYLLMFCWYMSYFCNPRGSVSSSKCHGKSHTPF